MRKSQSKIVPPCSPGLFPHREFPPWIALTAVFDAIAAALQAQAVPNDLQRLQTPLLDAAERIVEVASGGLRMERWHRRISTSVKLCQDAKDAVPAYVAVGALEQRQGDAITTGIETVIDGLVDAYVHVELPDEVKATMSTLSVDHLRTRH